MKSLFTRMKPAGKLSHMEQKEDSEPSPTQQKGLLDIKALLMNGSPLQSDKGFIAAMEGLRSFLAGLSDGSKKGQALEKSRQELLAVAGQQVIAFVASVSAHITDLLLTDNYLIKPPAIVALLTTSVARGGLKGVFPVLSFLVQSAAEAEAINQAFSIPLAPVLTKVLNEHLEDNVDVRTAIEEIGSFVSHVSRFKTTAELMQLEWRSLFPQESLSCADFLFASLGNSAMRPLHQLHCLQVLQALVGGVAERRRQESRDNKSVVDGNLLLTTFQSKHIILRIIGLAINAYDSYSSNPPPLRTLLWRLFGLAERLMQADQYAPLFGVSEEFERASGYQLLGSVILRIGELDTSAKLVDDVPQDISFISRDRAISKLLRLTQSLIFVNRTATPVEVTENSDFLVRNSTAFSILQRVFVDTQSAWLGLEVLNSMQFIISMHAANRQFVDHARTLPIFLAMYPGLCFERQQVVLKLLEAMLQGGVVPSEGLEALTSIFLESLNRNTPETPSPVEVEEDEILNLERMRKSRRRKARMDAKGVKCILRFVSNMIRNEIESNGQAISLARLLRKVGFVAAVFAQISSLVHSQVPRFVPPKGLPPLSSSLSEHVSLLSDLDCFTIAIQVSALSMPKVDRFWTECGLPVILATLDGPYASASLPLLWHFFHSGSARGLLLAIENGGSQDLKLRIEILSSVLQQYVADYTSAPKSSGVSLTTASSLNIASNLPAASLRFSTTWVEQGGVKALFGVLGKSTADLWVHRWMVVSLCIRIFGVQLMMAPETLSRADFHQLGRQIAASGILSSVYDAATIRTLMDLALSVNTLSHHDIAAELTPPVALILHRPRVLVAVLHLLPHCSETLQVRVMNLLVTFSSSKSTLKCHRNCEALASIMAINELLEVMEERVRTSLLRFCQSDSKENQPSTFDANIATFIVDIASHRVSPVELSKLKSITGMCAPVFFLHIQRSHHSYLNRGLNEQSVSAIEFELHSARSAAVSLPPISELAWPDNSLSVSLWINIRQYGREKPEEAGLSPEAGIEIADFFIGDSPEETPESAYKISIRNRRLCIRVKNENCIFDKVVIQPERWHFIVLCHRRGRMLKSAELLVWINGDVLDPVRCSWPHATDAAPDGVELPSAGSRFKNSLRPHPPPSAKERKATFTSMLIKDSRPGLNVQVVFGSHSLPPMAGHGSVWWLGSVLVYRGIFEATFIQAMHARGAGFQSSLHPRRTLAGVSEEEANVTIGSRKFEIPQNLTQVEKDTNLDPGKIVLAFHPRDRRDMEGVQFVGGASDIRSVPILDACRAVNGVGMILPFLAQMFESDRDGSESKAFGSLPQDYSRRLYAVLLLLQALLFRNPKNLRDMALGQSHYALVAHFLKHHVAPETFDARIPALFCAIACGAPARPLDAAVGVQGLLLRMVADQDNHGFVNHFIMQYFIFDWDLWRKTSLETQRSLFESLLWLVEEGPTLEKWRKQVADSLFRNMTFYADGFNWNFCFVYPTGNRSVKLPPDTSLWRAERMRQLGIIPFVLEVLDTLKNAETIVCLMPFVQGIVLSIIRSFIGNRDLRALCSFMVRGCLPNGFLMRSGEQVEQSPQVGFVVAFLETLSRTLADASKREWAEHVVQHFDFRFVTYLISPGVDSNVSIGAFQLLNVMLSIESKKDDSSSRKPTLSKSSFAARFEAAGGLKTIRFLVPVAEGDHKSCWVVYSMIFARLLCRVESPQVLFEVFKDQFLFTQGNRPWHDGTCSVKDVLALLDLMSGSNDLTTRIAAQRLSDFSLIHALLSLFRDRTFLSGKRLQQWDDDSLHFTDILLDFPLKAKSIVFIATPGSSPDATAALFMLFLFSNHTEFRRAFMTNISSHLLSLVLCAKLGEMHSALTEDLVQDHKWRVLQACSSAAWTAIIGLTRDVVLHGNTPMFYVKAEAKKQFTLFSRKTHTPDGQNLEDANLAPNAVCDKFVDALFGCVGTDRSFQFQSRVLIAVLETCEFLLKRDFRTGIEEVFNFCLFSKKLCARPECSPVLSLDWSCGEAFIDFLFQIVRQVDRFIGISELAGDKSPSDRNFLAIIRKDLQQCLVQWCMACLLVKPTAPDHANIRAIRLHVLLKKLSQPGNFLLLFNIDTTEEDIQTALLTEMCTHISFWARKGWWLLRTVSDPRRHANEAELDENMLPIKPQKRKTIKINHEGSMFPGLKPIEPVPKDIENNLPIKPPKSASVWSDTASPRPRNRVIESPISPKSPHPVPSPRSVASPRSGVPPSSVSPPPPDQLLVDSCCELWRTLVQSFGESLCSILSRGSGGSHRLNKDELLISKTGVALLVQDTDTAVDLLKQQVSFWTLTPCSFEACRNGITTQADYFAYLSHLIFTLDVQAVRNRTLAQAVVDDGASLHRQLDASMTPMIVARYNFLEKVRQNCVRGLEQRAQKSIHQKHEMQKRWHLVELDIWSAQKICEKELEHHMAGIEARWRRLNLSEGPLRQLSKVRAFPDLCEQYGLKLGFIRELEKNSQLKLISSNVENEGTDSKEPDLSGKKATKRVPPPPPARLSNAMPSTEKMEPSPSAFVPSSESVAPDAPNNGSEEIGPADPLDAPWQPITIENAIRRNSSLSVLSRPSRSVDHCAIVAENVNALESQSGDSSPVARDQIVRSRDSSVISTVDLAPVATLPLVEVNIPPIVDSDTSLVASIPPCSNAPVVVVNASPQMTTAIGINDEKSNDSKWPAASVSSSPGPKLLSRSESTINIRNSAANLFEDEVDNGGSDESGDELDVEESPTWRKLRCLVDPHDDIASKDVMNCERIEGLETRSAIFVHGARNVYVIDDFAMTNDSLEELPPPRQRFSFEVSASFGNLGNVVDRSTERELLPATPASSGVILHVAKQEGVKSQPLPREVKFWSYVNLRDVCRRHYLFQDLALELFDCDGKSCFLVLQSQREREAIFSRLNAVIDKNNERETSGDHQSRIGRPVGFRGMLSHVTQRWVTGQLSNFGYLMFLNTLAGRSYNDLTQYPVLPWVLADYVSASLDLKNPTVFRDLSKPMGALAEDRALDFRERYEDWPEEFPPAFHYGSHYSSSGIVLFYLLRLMPFTNTALQHQGGYFDKADRLFNQVSQVWCNASGTGRPLNEKGNLQDVRELVPEWYSLPAIFKNTNRFFLGRTQDGTNVHDVQLPPWANSDPTIFVRVLRAALESDFVSAHLHEWIDLIFGHSQRGKAAIDAQNVFYYMTYSGAVDVDTLRDPTIRAATISQIHNFGQTPQQLFKKPHPKRFGVEPTEATEPDSTSRPMKLDITDRSDWLQSSHPPSLANQPPFKQAISGLAWDGTKLVVVDGQKALIPPRCAQYVAWGFADYGIRLFSTKEREGVLSAYEFLHDEQINKVVASDMGHLVTGGCDTNVNVYSMSPMGLSFKASLCAHTGVITAMCVSTAFNLLVTGDSDCTVIFWDLATFRLVCRLLIHPGPIIALAVDDLFGDVATASEDWIFLWDVNGDLLTVTNTHWQSFSFSSLSAFWHQNDSIEKQVDELSDSDDETETRSPISPSHQAFQERAVPKVRYPPVLPARVVAGQAITALTFGPSSDSAWVLISGHGDGNICLWTLEFASLVNRRGVPPPWPIALPICMASSYSPSSRLCCVPHATLPVNDLPSASTQGAVNQSIFDKNTKGSPPDPRSLSTTTLPSTMYLHLLFSLPSSTSDHKSAITCLHCPEGDSFWSGDTNGIVNEWHVKQKLDQPQASNCSLCDTHFTYTTRRHRCRKCSLTVCQKCSRHRTPLPELGYAQPVRVCNECYALT